MKDLTSPPAQPRRRRSQSRDARGRRRLTLWVLTATVVTLAVFAVMWLPRKLRIESPAKAVVADLKYVWLDNALADAANARKDKAGKRPVYQYSVIPGGAYDVTELYRAMLNDPIVAAQYPRIARPIMHSEVLSADRHVHMSYRRNGQIFWTKNKVLLRKGESILTDGTTQIRARSGSGISDDPVEPTSANEPDEAEFDRLVEAGKPAARS